MSKGKDLGLVHVITGDGRGKTTSAFGLAMRAAGHGHRVCIIQFMKTGETTGEVLASKKLDAIGVSQFGTGRFIDPEHITPEDRRCASEGLELAARSLSDGRCELVILDEVNSAVSLGLLSARDVIKAIESRREGVEVVLTGRGAPKEFVDRADYVSVVEDRKHPFRKGVKARKGIEW